MPRLTVEQCGSANRAAFLDMIAFSEGTAGIGDDGYNVIVGSTKRKPVLFDNYASHPNVLVKLNATLSSTAAGRYQELYRFWKSYIVILGLQGMTPEVQDRIALYRLKERKAVAMIDAGDFDAAVHACRNYWASLPGAGYGQHEHKIESLRRAYANAGGAFA